MRIRCDGPFLLNDAYRDRPSDIRRAALFGIALIVVLGACSTVRADDSALAFEITFDEAVRSVPFSGRVLIFLAEDGKSDSGPSGFFGGGSNEPRARYSWFSRSPLFSKDVRDWKAGDSIRVNDPNGFPFDIGDVPAAKYQIQAVMHTNPDAPHSGTAIGNLYSEVITKDLDAAASGVVKIRIDRRVESRKKARDQKRTEEVEFRSRLLSKFHGRDIFHRAIVRRPKEYDGDSGHRFPALYIIPGFGSDHRQAAAMYSSMLQGFKTPFVQVTLDPTSPHGHHVFADSDNCGPRGRALVEEFVPYLESRFRLIPKAGGRLLTGHSSGGWSSLWLQVTYPEFFGGTWSTSPDSMDFHDFCGINLYDDKTNVFVDAEGRRRVIMRAGERILLYLDDMVRMEDTLGPGGQIHSFEAVFGPRGADGRPVPMFDRRTGKIDPAVVAAWRRYDIVQKIEREWTTLGPRVAGKITVIMGERDSFFLEGATRRLSEACKRLGGDARVILLPDLDHSTVIFSKPFREMAGEMSEQVAELVRSEVNRQTARPAKDGSDSLVQPVGR